MTDKSGKREVWKRKRNDAIKRLRAAGMSEEEIQAELASLREKMGFVAAPGVSDNLPARIKGRAYEKTYPSEKPIGDSQSDQPQERTWPHGPIPERRCRAHRKNGDQCKNAAILGGTVCRYHGAAPHVKAAARRRLEMAADRMAANLLGLALDADSDTVKLGATNSALDRAGLKAPSEVVLSQGETKPWEEIFEGIGSGSRAESRRARGLEVDELDAPHPAPCGATETPSAFDASSIDRSYEGPASTLSDEDPSRDRSHAEKRQKRRERRTGDSPAARVHHISGDAAVRLAAEANRAIGALPPPRELPPGRSRY